jgi:hypothetical protein
LISKKFEKEIVFESSVLAWIQIRNWIQMEQKCWIRIHNPARHYCKIKKMSKIADETLEREKKTYLYRFSVANIASAVPV